MEIWKDIYFKSLNDGKIYDYRGLYQVSSEGRVKSLQRIIIHSNGRVQTINEKIFKASKNSKGYHQVNLSKNGTVKRFNVHTLVAYMFIPNPENKLYIDHIIPMKNGGTNSVSNLRWIVSKKENSNNALTKINYSNATKLGNHPRARKIIQLDKNMNFIKEWDCIKEIKNELGIFNISNICSGKTKNNKDGFIWMYKDTYELYKKLNDYSEIDKKLEYITNK